MARSIYYFTDSEDIGGAEQALLMLIGSLDRDAWRPTLLHHEGAGIEPLADSARALGAAVRAVPPAPIGFEGARRLPALVRDLRRSAPDVFHAHLSWPLAAKYPLAAAVLARVPAVLATVHLFPEFTIDRSTYLQERLLACGVGKYIAVSHDLAAQLIQRLHWPRAKIAVIHNGIFVERFQRACDPRLRLELSGGVTPLFATLGRLTEQKGIDVLLEAATFVREARFVIAGDGPDRQRLEAAAARLGLGDRVRFLGQRGDVAEILAASDAFVLPSRWEGTSLAILEAMAAGKAVIASDVGGTRELIVNGESGILVQPGAARPLAEALRAVARDPGMAARIGAAARKRAVALFTIEAATSRVTAVYSELLERGGRGATL
ncbi:MAG: glycosyltransferase [Gaiellaceae bacterium]